MRNFKNVGFIGIHYEDFSVIPNEFSKQLGTSISSKIEKKDGSVIGLSKNMRRIEGKSYKDSFFLPIVGKNFSKISNFDKRYFDFLKIETFNSACAVLINNKHGKSQSYVDTSINYLKELNSLLINKILNLSCEIKIFHIMYADNMNIEERTIYETISKGDISVDFCRSDSREIFSDKNLRNSTLNIIKHAKYLFLSEHEDPIYLKTILENKNKNAFFVFHKPDEVYIFNKNQKYKIPNLSYNHNLNSVVGMGDLFASLFLNKITILNQELSFEKINNLTTECQKELLNFLLIK